MGLSGDGLVLVYISLRLRGVIGWYKTVLVLTIKMTLDQDSLRARFRHAPLGDILPARNRVERHGAVRLGTARELSTSRRIPVRYYDLSVAARHPFRVFTAVLRMELLSERTRLLAERALAQREISPTPGYWSYSKRDEFIAEGLETFRWHSRATVTLEDCHINHLTPRTIDIDLVQRMMRERGMPAKERIDGPPAPFKALEETVYCTFAVPGGGEYVRGSYTARFGEGEQRGWRRLYDQILAWVNREAMEQMILKRCFEEFPDDLAQLQAQKLAFFCYRVTAHAWKAYYYGVEFVSLAQVVEGQFARLRAPHSKQLIMEADTDPDGFQRMLGAPVLDEFCLYEQIQQESWIDCQPVICVCTSQTDAQMLYGNVSGTMMTSRGDQVVPVPCQSNVSCIRSPDALVQGAYREKRGVGRYFATQFFMRIPALPSLSDL
ncbi:uncharacterized protein P174DRAFT_462387 [Aspergillus novofumigatus IBT 16806]|uniref:2-oxoadipate dioxygenase/decarboxylase n=1 Tax=Aspergillus novofumigatus (strain IBT 16806) TaxID=1392255 RepID=A0A2I1C2M7_ASPN1|nr:uncharacterized protein P174DRAFT_462387 [Aspergillus novofumigatus IBT 16806]PKX91841.1 hypothetical protein P174DRAFT_462387 [Aspergillus novofumigatus IBT 16806]